MRDSYRIQVFASLRPYIDNLKASLKALRNETETITKGETQLWSLSLSLSLSYIIDADLSRAWSLNHQNSGTTGGEDHGDTGLVDGRRDQQRSRQSRQHVSHSIRERRLAIEPPRPRSIDSEWSLTLAYLC